MSQERVTRRIRQLEKKLFAEMQASERTQQTLQNTRTGRSQLDNSPGGETLSFKEQVRKLTEQLQSVADDVFARAWGGELGRELCRMAEPLGKNAVLNTISFRGDEVDGRTVAIQYSWTSWGHLIKQPGLVLTEIEHTKSKSMQRQGGTGGTRNHLVDPAGRRLLAKSCEWDRRQTTSLVQSEMWGLLQNITGWRQPSDGKTDTKKGMREEETPATGIQRSS